MLPVADISGVRQSSRTVIFRKLVDPHAGVCKNTQQRRRFIRATDSNHAQRESARARSRLETLDTHLLLDPIHTDPSKVLS